MKMMTIMQMMMTMKKTMTSKRALVAAAGIFLTSAAILSGPASSAQQGKQPTVRTVEGTVTGKGNTPLPNTKVFLKDTKTLFIKSYLTDSEGHFKFAQVSMSSDYDLWAESDGNASKTKHISTFNDKTDLDYNLTLDK